MHIVKAREINDVLAAALVGGLPKKKARVKKARKKKKR